ncbi:MAG: hypothetical protein ABIS23_03210 [Sphingomicrobium sp.]
MGQWSKEILEKLLAPEITDFSEAVIPDLSDRHPEAKHWIANHLLNSTFRGNFPPDMKPLVLNILYRAQTAFRYYHEARSLTLEFLGRQQPFNPSSALYFSAVAAWEVTVINTQLAQDVVAKLNGNFFEQGDGSDDDRLWAVANRIKHCGSDIAAGKHTEDFTVPMWLANRGLVTRVAELSFEEMATYVDGLASVADTLRDPATAAEKYAASKTGQ